MSEVHARHPHLARMTFCGRSIGWDLHPDVGRPLGCGECRRLTAMARDREARGLPELCFAMSRPFPRRGGYTLCLEPVEGHRKRPDLDYDYPWHTGDELPPDWDADPDDDDD